MTVYPIELVHANLIDKKQKCYTRG
jgi:hypothetical protein